MYLDALRSVFTWKSIIDILIVAFFIYQIISMLRGTRAAQVLIGILVIFVAYVFSNILEFETVKWVINKFYSSFIIVVIVLFQDDIRRLLSRFGKGPFVSGIDISSGAKIIDEIINSARTLSHDRTGALIVFERSIGLDKLYDHSVKIDGLVSEQLINSIFHSFSPLHDGAVIIQRNRLSCASAQLPLSKNPEISKKTGTRHSAAVGISEETDAVVLVVSEETGNISIAWHGNLQKQQTPENARRMLYALLIPVGIKNPLTRIIEHKFFFTLKKILNSFRSILLQEKNPLRDPKKGYFEKVRIAPLDSFFLKKVEEENRESSVSAIPVKLWIKDSKHEEIPVTNGIILSSGDSYNQSEDFDKADDAIVDSSEALRVLSEIRPSERFDPPLPIMKPPTESSIGEVHISKPKISESHTEKNKNKIKGKN